MPASSVLDADAFPAETTRVSPRRLIVTWRDPLTNTYEAVGRLECRAEGYEFSYLPRAATIQGFRPFLGFSDISRQYWSTRLFPLFAERVMDPARPDRPRWLESLGLAGDPHVMEVLARSGGRRDGDTIELFAEPHVSPDGATSCTFLIHGVRHVEGATDVIDSLHPGDELLLVDDPSNPVNALAIQVADRDRRPVGWVPNPLLGYVHDVRRHGDHRLTVVRANGAEVGPHLRLLVRLDGRVEPAYRPFAESPTTADE